MRCLAVFSLFALAACQPAAPDARGVDHDETLLTLAATGRAETKPDEARFTLGVETLGANAREASRANNATMQRLAGALRQFGVEEKDLQTQNLRPWSDRLWQGSRANIRASNQVEVRLRSMDKVSDAITAATENGANLVGGPRLVVSDREAANKSAYAMAYKAARSRADAYAEAAGLQGHARPDDPRRRRGYRPANRHHGCRNDRADGGAGRLSAAAAVQSGNEPQSGQRCSVVRAGRKITERRSRQAKARATLSNW